MAYDQPNTAVQRLWNNVFDYWWDKGISAKMLSVLIMHWNLIRPQFDPHTVFPEIRLLDRELIKKILLHVFYTGLPETRRQRMTEKPSLSYPDLQRPMVEQLVRVTNAVKRFDPKAAAEFIEEEKRQARLEAKHAREARTAAKKARARIIIGEQDPATPPLDTPDHEPQ